MERRGPLAQLLIFVVVLAVINAVAALLGLPFRVSIVGSVVLSIVVGGIMALINRR